MMNLTKRIPLYLNSMFCVKEVVHVLKVLFLYSASKDHVILISLCYRVLFNFMWVVTHQMQLCCLPSMESNNAVKSNELKWLPNGSEFILRTEKSTLDSTSKTKTYTSFNCSQDSLPEFLNNPIAPKHDDIIVAKLGPGQVWLVVESVVLYIRT